MNKQKINRDGRRKRTAELIRDYRTIMATNPFSVRERVYEELAKKYGFSNNTIRTYITFYTILEAEGWIIKQN